MKVGDYVALTQSRTDWFLGDPNTVLVPAGTIGILRRYWPRFDQGFVEFSGYPGDGARDDSYYDVTGLRALTALEQLAAAGAEDDREIMTPSNWLASSMPARLNEWLVRDTPEYAKEADKTIAASRLPQNWIGLAEYEVGSEADKTGNMIEHEEEEHYTGGSNYEEQFWAQSIGLKSLAGGIVYEFWLEETEHITVAIIELNGKFHFLDDRGD